MLFLVLYCALLFLLFVVFCILFALIFVNSSSISKIDVIYCHHNPELHPALNSTSNLKYCNFDCCRSVKKCNLQTLFIDCAFNVSSELTRTAMSWWGDGLYISHQPYPPQTHTRFNPHLLPL